MDLACPHCRETTVLEQPYPYHAGFGNQGYLYCDACPAVVIFSSFDWPTWALVAIVSLPFQLAAVFAFWQIQRKAERPL